MAGIAGVNPKIASIGSAVWADYVVDGDLAHEIDAREIPKGWPSLEAAFSIGNRVVSEIVDHWEKFSDNIPAE